MKKQIFTETKRAVLLMMIAASSLTVINCSKDDDTPPTYDFENEFENIGEMPELVIEEPNFEEPDLGGVEESAATQSLIADFNDGGDLSAETQASIDAMDDFTADLSAEVKAEASNLTATRIEELLNLESFNGDLAELVTKLENMPDEIKALLPIIRFSEDFNLSQLNLTKSGIDLEGKDFFAQVGQGPCFDAANEAYENAMATPIATLAAQESQIASFQSAQEAAAETRQQSRQNNVNDGAETYKEMIRDNAVEILNIALSVESTDPALAETLKMYALVYTIQGSQAIKTWRGEASRVIQERLEEELAKILEIKDKLENETEANFNAIQSVAQGILDNALDNCHNQGSGN